MTLEDRARTFALDRVRPLAGDESDPAGLTKRFVSLLAEAGLLAPTVPAPFGTQTLRDMTTIREALAYESSLADTAFVMQGLGSFPLARAGNDVLQAAWLPRVVKGTAIAAFALTEPDAGSDLGGIRTAAVASDGRYRLHGEKTFISNAGIADFYTVLARTGTEPGPKGLTMFFVEATDPGLSVEPLAPMAPHPIGRLGFDGVAGVRVGAEGSGYGLALETLATFRPTVAAAACGLARRALDEAVAWTKSRKQFGQPLCDFQGVQMALAEMRVDLDASRALVQRAVDGGDAPGDPVAGSVAKLFATEAAQRVIDRAVQLHGGAGVMRGSTVERLYREVRALRIYEGTSEIQKLIIAHALLRGE